MEERKISFAEYIGIIATLLCLICAEVVAIALLLPICIEQSENYFNPKQENVDERFIVEYRSIDIDVYHDNELNVTCYKITNTGLSCIPDAEIGRR